VIRSTFSLGTRSSRTRDCSASKKASFSRRPAYREAALTGAGGTLDNLHQCCQLQFEQRRKSIRRRDLGLPMGLQHPYWARRWKSTRTRPSLLRRVPEPTSVGPHAARRRERWPLRRRVNPISAKCAPLRAGLNGPAFFIHWPSSQSPTLSAQCRCDTPRLQRGRLATGGSPVYGVSLWLLSACSAAWGGGSGLNTLVVVNARSPHSIEVGNYFRRSNGRCRRRNLLRIDWAGGNTHLDRYAILQRPLEPGS
jgi:hypothetical protein